MILLYNFFCEHSAQFVNKPKKNLLQHVIVLLINAFTHLKLLARILAADPQQKRINDHVLRIVATNYLPSMSIQKL